MKVTGFRVETFTYSRGRKLGDANGVIPEDRFTGQLFFLETDENITGISWGASPSLAKMFRVVEGKDPRSVVGLWKQMNDYVFKFGNDGADFYAIGIIDAALWDLKAKIAGEPLWRLLGASEPHVKAYASGLDTPLSDEELAGFYRDFADMGVDAGKLKVGLDIDRDMQRLGIVRDVLAKNARHPHLMIDINEYWSPKQAIRYISRYEEEFDLTWVEEPARRWDYLGLRKVSDAVRAAVTTGENLKGVEQYYPLIHHGAVDIVQTGRNRGITVVMQIAAFAFAYDLPVTINGSWGDVMAHAAAAMPNHIMLEVQDVAPPACLKIDSYIDDGYVHLGTEPGFGITVDEEKLAEMKKIPSPETGFDHNAKPFAAHIRREGAGLFVVPPRSGEGYFGE